MKRITKIIGLLLLIVFLALVLTGCSVNSHFVKVKYRDDPVNLSDSRWDKIADKESTLVDGAWYDVTNEYMIINLSGTYYHYCSLPSSVWSSFETASSFGSYYNSNIKGKYDCRVNPVPDY